jgi:hypothetical protein
VTVSPFSVDGAQLHLPAAYVQSDDAEYIRSNDPARGSADCTEKLPPTRFAEAKSDDRSSTAASPSLIATSWLTCWSVRTASAGAEARSLLHASAIEAKTIATVPAAARFKTIYDTFFCGASGRGSSI